MLGDSHSGHLCDIVAEKSSSNGLCSWCRSVNAVLTSLTLCGLEVDILALALLSITIGLGLFFFFLNSLDIDEKSSHHGLLCSSVFS